MNVKTLLLIGATGLVGSEVLKLLKEDNYYKHIVILTRRKLIEYEGIQKFNQIQIDFDHLSNYSDYIITDHVISTLGSTIKKAGTKENFKKIDYSYTLKTAEIAKKNGAEHFLLVSSLGADPKSRFFYNQIKGETEQAILNLGFRSVSIFRPSVLKGKRNEFRLGEFFGKTLLNMFSFAIPKKYKPTESYQLAKVIISVARKNQPGVTIYEADEIQDIYYKQL